MYYISTDCIAIVTRSDTSTNGYKIETIRESSNIEDCNEEGTKEKVSNK